jgi:hypothetical protein
LTEHKPGEDIDTKLQRQEMTLKLQKEIEKMENRTQSEVQPKKKFELYQQLQELNKKLEDTENA